MVCPMPWRRDLGGPRVQFEIADYLRGQGVKVDKLSPEDLPSPSLAWRALPGSENLLFAHRVAQHLVRHGARYDVVDAHQGTLVASRAQLGMAGGLVVRTAGLGHHFDQWHRSQSPRLAGWHGRLNRLRDLSGAALSRRAAERSFLAADRILACNQAEAWTLALMGHGYKTVTLGHAVAPDTWAACQTVPVRTSECGATTVAVVAAWHPRKGTADLASIVQRLWRSRPDLQLLLLGTGLAEDVVRRDLGVGADRRVRVVPHYDPLELPGLLSETTLGLFPSHVEGWPLVVQEQMAAGRPVLAYDIPGPADILEPVDSRLLVGCGDAAGMADRALELLSAQPADYEELATRCRSRAAELLLPDHVEKLLEVYEDAAREGRRR